MLYKKNKEAQLSKALFRNPTSEYRGTPFWSWNCKLDKELLLKEINSLKEMGFGGFHIHSRTGLDTEYLGEEFLDMVRACCDKAESEQMLAWLYDEDRWASGAAGGKVTAYKPFRRKTLCLYREDRGWTLPKTKALSTGEPYLLACYDVCMDPDGFLSTYKRIARDEVASGNKWYAYVVNDAENTWFNNQTYPDVMDRETVGAFIRSTHEAYKQAVGERFGKTIPAIFTDEPNICNDQTGAIPTPDFDGVIRRGWSRFFEEEYQKAYGEDILNKLPEVIWNKKDETDRLTKYRYHDLKAQLFSNNFTGQIGDWCRSNGISMTGHFLYEPNLKTQAITCGDILRSYPKMDIPGIDILCDFVEHTTAKQAQSVVHQYGKEGMVSELYGVTNWDFDFRGHKFQGDWQAALGVTVRVPHLNWVSMKGEAKRDYPAALGYQSPWYKEYPLIENHYARLNTALTRGQAIVNVGVIHPIESCWISTGPNTQDGIRASALEENFAKVTDWLLENQLDFDFIGESLIPELQDGKDVRRLGQMRYCSIVVPGCLSLRSTTVEYLKRFSEAGGQVLFMGGCPGFLDGVKSDACRTLFESSTRIPFDASALCEALEEARTLRLLAEDGKNARDYLYNYRLDGDTRWLFIARGKRPGVLLRTYGESQKDVVEKTRLSLRLPEEYRITEYDTMSGEIHPRSCVYEDGGTVLPLQLDGYSGILLKLEAGRSEIREKPEEPVEESKTVLRGFFDYELSEPNVLLLDQAEWALDGGEYQPIEELLRIDNICSERLCYPPKIGHVAQPYTYKKEKPTHTLKLRFRIQSEIPLCGTELAIEEAENTEIRLNGKAVLSTANGYFTDKSIRRVGLPALEAGENILELAFPYGAKTFVEWCYLLGDFGVRVMGTERVLTPRQKKLAFGDVTAQGLPYYGANITYFSKIKLTEAARLLVHAPFYRGAMIGVSVDGKRIGSIALPPYSASTGVLEPGVHTVGLTLFGNRHNCFGPLHMVNSAVKWIGPNVWRTEGDDWCYEYRTKAFGILKGPEISVLKEGGDE